MTIILNNTGNPITREERIKINENWDKIIGGLTNLQYQINILAGGEEVDEILRRIAKATEDAITATTIAEEATTKANQATEESITATENAKTATMDTLKAKAEAEKATAEALVKIAEVNNLITETKQINATSQDKIKEMTTLITTGNQLYLDLNNLQAQLKTEIVNSQTATANANAAYEKVKGWDTAVEWSSTTTYSRNNVVIRNGSTYQSKVNNNTNNPPSKTDANWILLAQRGVDGLGSVVSVNGVSPDENGNVVIDTGLLDAYTKAETDGRIATAERKFTSQGYASNDLESVTEEAFRDSTISGLKLVTASDNSFLPEQGIYIGEVVVDIEGAVDTHYYQLIDVVTGNTFTRVIRNDGTNTTDSGWVKGGGGGSGGKFVTVPLKLKTTATNQKNWTIPNDQLDLTSDSVVVYFNTTYLRPEEYTILGSVGTGYKLNFDSPESAIADNNIDIVIYKNVPDLNGLISGTALVDGSVGMTKLSGEVKDAIAEAGQAKNAWKMGEFNNSDVINLGSRSISKTLYIDGVGGGWNGAENVETLNISIPFDAQFSGIIKATYTSFWGHQESHGGATVTYRVANYAERGGVKQADYIIETITDSFAKTYDIKKPVFIGNDLMLPIMKAPMGSMPFMIKLEVDGYLGENKLLFDSVNASTCKSLDTGSPTGGGYPWKAQTSSFLNSTGGTMTGDLTIEKNTAGIKMQSKKVNGAMNEFIVRNSSMETSTMTGGEMLVDGVSAFRVAGEKNVQFKDDNGSWYRLQDLKNSVSDGKKKVASAITGKGVNTASDATFDQMATNINQISTGKKSHSGTITSSSDSRQYSFALPSQGYRWASWITITLPFKPSLIYATSPMSHGLRTSIYQSAFDGYSTETTKSIGSFNGSVVEETGTINLFSPVSTNGTSWTIDMPVSIGAVPFSFVAYE